VLALGGGLDASPSAHRHVDARDRTLTAARAECAVRVLAPIDGCLAAASFASDSLLCFLWPTPFGNAAAGFLRTLSLPAFSECLPAAEAVISRFSACAARLTASSSVLGQNRPAQSAESRPDGAPAARYSAAAAASPKHRIQKSLRIGVWCSFLFCHAALGQKSMAKSKEVAGAKTEKQGD